MINTTTATTAELLAFFNANTGGAQVKKFADRKTAERRVNLLLEEMAEEAPLEFVPDTDICGPQDAAERDSMLAAMNSATSPAPIDYIRTEASDLLVKQLAHAVRHAGDCPSCGGTQDITSGRIVERAGHQHIVDEGYFMCHSCGHEWGTKDNHYVRPNGKPITSRPAMAASLKLDRQIVSVASGIIYKNACQVWKAGLVSSSQCDRLSAVLYGAAKAGNRLMSVTVNGHVFALAVK